MINRKDLTGESDIGTGLWGTLGNIIWFILAGYRVRIPIYDTVRSLNLSTAAGILLVQAIIGTGMLVQVDG